MAIMTTTTMDDKDEKFIIPNVNNALDKPEDMAWGDYMLTPDRPLLQRHRELARMAAHGKTNKEIATALNYTDSRVSVLLSSTKIREAVNVYRDKLFTMDAETRMKDLLPDAFNAMEQVLTSTSISDADKEGAARWVIEKVTGKPAQQVDIKTEISIGNLYDKLDRMDIRTVSAAPTALDSASGEAIDISVKKPEEVVETVILDDFSSWLDKNL